MVVLVASGGGALILLWANAATVQVAVASTATETALAAANIWKPTGWMIGGVLIGASQHTSLAVTWGCYKPSIGEVDYKETSIKPITLADLAAHPDVERVLIYASTASTSLSEVRVENKSERRYLIRDVILLCGCPAYHAERISKNSSKLSEAWSERVEFMPDESLREIYDITIRFI
jgi:hypothetical protein